MAYFNSTTCPKGWSSANGSNGTVDLRGEFIRGLDNGRGIDPGRTLASLQQATEILNRGCGEAGSVTTRNYDARVSAGNRKRILGNERTTRHYWDAVRPRNIALLACMKI